MSGAYVAKPAETSDPDVPTGWDFDWPFPGPHPPGYEPEYTLSLEAQAYMIPGESVSDITSLLKDQVTFTTNEPEAPLSWSATLSNPGAIGLRLAGGDNYLGSVEEDYSEVGDFWGGEPTFEFDVGLSDVGKTITLTVVSTPFVSYPVTATADIQIISTAQNVPASVSASIVVSSFTNPNAEKASATISLRTIRSEDSDEDYAYMFILTPFPGPAAPWVLGDWAYYPAYLDELSENTCTASDLTLTSELSPNSGESYTIRFFMSTPSGWGDVTATLTFEATVTFLNGSETTKELTINWTVSEDGSYKQEIATLIVDADSNELTWTTTYEEWIDVE